MKIIFRISVMYVKPVTPIDVMFVYTISKKGETIGSGQVVIRRHTSKFIDLIREKSGKEFKWNFISNFVVFKEYSTYVILSM